ncbi:hypothetical protein [Pseudomonas abietaniphila]|uniref:hypothetical protein n=1 Tax=Pseudomonas abietaniphila TaxID=89065 RepID=UPI00078324BA|nr:hypothetical protein [Pseudomonas abietaniphila]
MNGSHTPYYTNDVSPEFLRDQNTPAHTAEHAEVVSEDTAARARAHADYLMAHPCVGIYRIATEGSQTRDGGVVNQTGSTMTFLLDNGEEIRAAHKGDTVTYPDGSSARISTGAGVQYRDLALVGSRLSNGDEIINTRQSGALILARDGAALGDDFLPPITS